MTSTHTPGPWTIHEKGNHPRPFVCGAWESTEWGEEQFVVAYLVGANVEANARLIVAAPDYAAAVEQMLAFRQAGGDGWWKGWDMLIAAHAKATGGTHD